MKALRFMLMACLMSTGVAASFSCSSTEKQGPAFSAMSCRAGMGNCSSCCCAARHAKGSAAMKCTLDSPGPLALGSFTFSHSKPAMLAFALVAPTATGHSIGNNRSAFDRSPPGIFSSPGFRHSFQGLSPPQLA